VLEIEPQAAWIHMKAHLDCVDIVSDNSGLLLSYSSSFTYLSF
jgi:hypothetical protein